MRQSAIPTSIEDYAEYHDLLGDYEKLHFLAKRFMRQLLERGTVDDRQGYVQGEVDPDTLREFAKAAGYSFLPLPRKPLWVDLLELRRTEPRQPAAGPTVTLALSPASP